MNIKMKLIWDFRCVNALQVAEKYKKETLKNFLIKENYEYTDIEVKQYSMFYSLVQLVVDEKDVMNFRKVLIPDRGEVVE